MRRHLATLCASVVMASPVICATTYTGTFVGGEGSGDIVLAGYPDGTDFSFFFTTSAPLLSGVAQYTYESAFDDYFDGGPSYGGDNEPNYQTHAILLSFCS